MIGLLGINKIELPLDCIESACQHMRSVGMQRLEGVALFAGHEKEDSFYIEKTIIPKQKAYSLESGLLYAIPGDELHRINVMLYENNMSLVAQIHSHPTRAYHSATDDAYPVITTVGGISIVVPNFASGPVSITNWAVYRLSIDNYWTELNLKEKLELIKIV